MQLMVIPTKTYAYIWKDIYFFNKVFYVIRFIFLQCMLFCKEIYVSLFFIINVCNFNLVRFTNT